jgi:hypothetical protein
MANTIQAEVRHHRLISHAERGGTDIIATGQKPKTVAVEGVFVTGFSLLRKRQFLLSQIAKSEHDSMGYSEPTLFPKQPSRRDVHVSSEGCFVTVQQY